MFKILNKSETKFNRSIRNNKSNDNPSYSEKESIFRTQGCLLWKSSMVSILKRTKGKWVILSKKTLEQSHECDMLNYDYVALFQE